MTHTTAQFHSRFVLFLAFSLSLFVSACANHTAKPDPVVEPRPDWIDNPGQGVSASAAYHVRGHQAQEELAIARAREELAKRLGVTISSTHAIQERVANERTTTVAEKEIMEEVHNKEVRSMVNAKWRDPATGVLWVWVVPAR